MTNDPKFYDDDGTEINPNLFPKPVLCLTCKKDNNSDEEIRCAMTRLDQRDEEEFKCFTHEQLDNM